VPRDSGRWIGSTSRLKKTVHADEQRWADVAGERRIFGSKPVSGPRDDSLALEPVVWHRRSEATVKKQLGVELKKDSSGKTLA
jgi:hypothetical protein